MRTIRILAAGAGVTGVFALAAGPVFAGPINGTDRDDRLFGSKGSEIIRALDGDDAVDGRGGLDEIYGGRGNDDLRLGPGKGRIDGGAGKDALVGSPQANVLDGGRSGDTILPEGGADEVVAGDGNDRIFIINDRSMDLIDCGSGEDIVYHASPEIEGMDNYHDCETFAYDH